MFLSDSTSAWYLTSSLPPFLQAALAIIVLALAFTLFKLTVRSCAALFKGYKAMVIKKQAPAVESNPASTPTVLPQTHADATTPSEKDVLAPVEACGKEWLVYDVPACFRKARKIADTMPATSTMKGAMPW
nr:hypothetical protein [uncultured Halomonas sp.]